jgi:hypothetical protein
MDCLPLLPLALSSVPAAADPPLIPQHVMGLTLTLTPIMVAGTDALGLPHDLLVVRNGSMGRLNQCSSGRRLRGRFEDHTQLHTGLVGVAVACSRPGAQGLLV